MAKKPEATNFDKLLEELNGAKKAGADGTVEAAPVQKKSGFVTRTNAARSFSWTLRASTRRKTSWANIW